MGGSQKYVTTITINDLGTFIKKRYVLNFNQL